MRPQALIERRDDFFPAAFIFRMRKAGRVVIAVSLQRTLLDPALIGVKVRKALDIDSPEIERRLAPAHPFSERPASTTSGRNAKRVEPAPTYMFRQAAVRPRMKLPSA